MKLNQIKCKPGYQLILIYLFWQQIQPPAGKLIKPMLFPAKLKAPARTRAFNFTIEALLMS